MNSRICETKKLTDFLEGTLSGDQEQALILHLDTCSSCAGELEQMAAEPHRWQEAKSHLAGTLETAILKSPSNEASQPLPYAIQQILKMLDPTDDPASMGRLAGYEVIGVVGSGSMGVVLKAIDPKLDRVVALKVMNPTLANWGTARQRFAREAKAAAGILHPNVIAIHGVWTERELPFLVMPYIAGMSLQQRLNSQGALELVEVLRIGSQIAAGLAAAHQKGLIHRDIKPSNCMLDEGVETAIITDFGLARTIDDATMTRTGAITGTPEFMSPEQARGDTIDCASDIFSLGSLLYALCTGKCPFRAKTTLGCLRKITDENPPLIRESHPDVPVWLCRLIERMHAKSPSERPSACQVRDLLEGCLAHVYQPDRIPLPEELAQPNSDRLNRISKLLFTGGFITMSLILITLWTVFFQQQGAARLDDGNASPIISHETAIDSEAKVFKTLNMMFPKTGEKGTLDIGIKRGFIEVVGHDQPGVVIEILTPPEFVQMKNREDSLKKFFAPQYDLKTNKEKNLIKLGTYNQDFVLNLRVKVPRNTDLILDAYDDGIEVRQVRGVIDARSQHGPIRLLDIAGSASAYSRNGYLKIRFQEISSTALLDFESYNGSIDLHLPPSISAFTAISSGTGQFLSAFELEPTDYDYFPDAIRTKVKNKTSKYQFAKIHGGGVPLRIECEKGDIVIRETPEGSTD